MSGSPQLLPDSGTGIIMECSGRRNFDSVLRGQETGGLSYGKESAPEGSGDGSPLGSSVLRRSSAGRRHLSDKVYHGDLLPGLRNDARLAVAAPQGGSEGSLLLSSAVLGPDPGGAAVSVPSPVFRKNAEDCGVRADPDLFCCICVPDGVPEEYGRRFPAAGRAGRTHPDSGLRTSEKLAGAFS